MKNTCRRILCLLASVLIAFGSISVVNAEEAAGYVVAFVSEHASVDIYYTQDYIQADETGVSNALARNSETGGRWTYLEMDRIILRSTWKKDM